jgi:hypothetical protein
MDLNMVKREKWTEADIEALPNGEHDYFERKSGRLFSDRGELLGALAKALSAMANSGVDTSSWALMILGFPTA